MTQTDHVLTALNKLLKPHVRVCAHPALGGNPEFFVSFNGDQELVTALLTEFVEWLVGR